jgi:hypothetical protein
VGFRSHKSKAPAGATENFFRPFRGFGHPAIFPTALAVGYFLPRLRRHRRDFFWHVFEAGLLTEAISGREAAGLQLLQHRFGRAPRS